MNANTANAETSTGTTTAKQAKARAVDVLTPAEARYLDQLAAEIALRGDVHGGLLAEVTAAHERRRKFASEILVGETRRARIAKRALVASVFVASNVRNALSQIEDAEARRHG